MINFDEELKKFEPSAEIDEASDLVRNHDLKDMMDMLDDLLKESKESN
jgi:hypothetical protein